MSLLVLTSRLITGSFDIYVDTLSPLKNNNSKPEVSRLLSPLDKQPIAPNPNFQSPYEGTDIASKPAKVVNCNKQTQCIVPALQLQKTFNVYYCKRVSHGVRFYYLIREGLTLHPNINLVEKPEDADVIIYLPESANWAKSECSKDPAYFSKVGMCCEMSFVDWFFS